MKTRNLLRTAAILAAFSGLGVASAQSLLNNAEVTVSVTLESKCRWDTTAPGALAVDFGTYTAFQTTDKTPATPQTFTVECTRGAGTPTVSWDSTSGVVKGLQYTVSLTAGATVGGTAATTSTIGTGDKVTYTLSGNMPQGQAGDATEAGTDTRLLTVAF